MHRRGSINGEESVPEVRAWLPPSSHLYLGQGQKRLNGTENMWSWEQQTNHFCVTLGVAPSWTMPNLARRGGEVSASP